MARPAEHTVDAIQQTAAELQRRLNALGDPKYAANLSWFFKTGPGEYGEGDVFIGIRMPTLRKLCREFREMPLDEVDRALASPVHEHRMAALVVITERAKRHARRGETAARRELFEFYLAHTDTINNWDLVDVSCRDIVGEYLLSAGDIRPLRKLARSKSLWERRVAIISTAAFIRAGDNAPTFEIATLLLADGHDLIHKAVGWMLREAGKRDAAGLDDFLTRHAATMPRTALRYAIEKLPEARRKEWLGRRMS